jgi:hypothetical protein
MKPLIATVLVALGFAAAPPATASETAAARPWTIERYYTHEVWHSSADVGTTNPGPADVYVSQRRITTPLGNAVGIANGFAVNLRKPYVEFHWTANLPEGTLVLEGAVSLRAKAPQHLAIVGGTGAYDGTRGTVTVTDAGKKGSLAVVRYRD